MKKANAPSLDLLTLLKAKVKCLGQHEGSGLTTEEISLKLGIDRSTARYRVKKLLNEGKLVIKIVKGTSICGYNCTFVTYEATGKESKK